MKTLSRPRWVDAKKRCCCVSYWFDAASPCTEPSRFFTRNARCAKRHIPAPASARPQAPPLRPPAWSTKNNLDDHKGSSHRARLRFQFCKVSGQRADASRLETLKTFTGGALWSAEISDDYVEKAGPIVWSRVAQVGIRLAWLLNTALK